MKTFIYLAAMAVLFVCCKSKEKVTYLKSEYVSQQPVVATEDNAAPQQSLPGKDSQDMMRTEQVKPMDGTPVMHYYIIVGSFSVELNAIKLQASLIGKGYRDSKIMQNREGMYRVSIMGSDDLASMQSELSYIRNSYPQFGDAWLLASK